jgi:hypothetical protein
MGSPRRFLLKKPPKSTYKYGELKKQKNEKKRQGTKDLANNMVSVPCPQHKGNYRTTCF